MKRSEIKRRPLADTVLSALEPEVKEYREHDGDSLYLRVRPDGNKSWQLRYKKAETMDSGHQAGATVLVDGRKAARIDTGETVSFKLKPGRHIIGIAGDDDGNGVCSLQIVQPVKETSTDLSAGGGKNSECPARKTERIFAPAHSERMWTGRRLT